MTPAQIAPLGRCIFTEKPVYMVDQVVDPYSSYQRAHSPQPEPDGFNTHLGLVHVEARERFKELMWQVDELYVPPRGPRQGKVHQRDYGRNNHARRDLARMLLREDISVAELREHFGERLVAPLERLTLDEAMERFPLRRLQPGGPEIESPYPLEVRAKFVVGPLYCMVRSISSAELDLLAGAIVQVTRRYPAQLLDEPSTLEVTPVMPRISFKDQSDFELHELSVRLAARLNLFAQEGLSPLGSSLKHVLVTVGGD